MAGSVGYDLGRERRDGLGHGGKAPGDLRDERRTDARPAVFCGLFVKRLAPGRRGGSRPPQRPHPEEGRTGGPSRPTDAAGSSDSDRRATASGRCQRSRDQPSGPDPRRTSDCRSPAKAGSAARPRRERIRRPRRRPLEAMRNGRCEGASIRKRRPSGDAAPGSRAHDHPRLRQAAASADLSRKRGEGRPR